MKLYRALLLAVATILASCGGGQDPSPGLAEHYDAGMRWCKRTPSSAKDVCEAVRTSSGPRASVTVVFGKAGGLDVALQVQIVSGGTGGDRNTARVPKGEYYRDTLQIDRRACESFPCRLTAQAFVAGRLVLEEDFSFT